MKAFQQVLAELPDVAHLDAIELYRDDDIAPCARIENKPGQAGSLAVYHQLHWQFTDIDAAAAREGLALYAEHVADARAHPGKHPNIDRLLSLLAGAGRYRVTLIPR